MSHSWRNGNGVGSMPGAGADYVNHDAPLTKFDGSHYESVGNGAGRQADVIDTLTNFFGEPNKERLARINNIDYEKDLYEQENNDYPEAVGKLWGGPGEHRNGYLSRVLIEKTKASENWQLTRMAPWQSHEQGGLTFEWDITKFNRTMLDREPEESLPRLMTNTRSSGKTTMVRYGIAMLLEANFAGTAVGRKMYLMNLEQIRIATVETCAYGVMVNIMEHRPYEDIFNTRFTSENQRTRQDIDKLFQQETAMFGIVHKERGGYETIKARLKKTLEDRNEGNGGDFTVVPQGMAQHLKDTMDSKYYLEGASGQRKDILREGTAVVESRGFTQGEHRAPHDPCFRHQTIGGFQTLDDSHLQAQDVKDYRTDHMDTLGYDEDKDSFFRFRYKNLYQYAGVWNFNQPQAPLTDKIGRGFAYDSLCYTWGQMIRKCTDMERTVDKLLLLSPEKQTEFMQKLRLLNKDDPRVKLQDGLRYPTAEGDGKFVRNLFDGMCAEDFNFEKTYSIGERQNLDRKRARGTYAVNEMEELNDFEKYQQGKVGHKTNNGIFGKQDLRAEFENGDSTMDYAFTEEKEETFMEDESNRTITKHIPGITITRRMRGPDGTGRGYYNANQDAQAGSGSALVQLIKEVKEMGAKAKLDESDYAKLIKPYLDAIHTLPGASDSIKLVLVNEFKRVVKMVVEKLKKDMEAGNSIDLDTITDAIVAHWVPFASRFQLRSALDNIHAHYTPLEHANRAADADLHAPQAATVIAPGLWDPEQSQEDGQIKLFMFDGCTLDLEHDAYAISLAERHNVAFDISDEMTDSFTKNGFKDLDTQIQRGAHRDRVDSLIWSIVMSTLLKKSLTKKSTTRGKGMVVGEKMAIITETTIEELQQRLKDLNASTINQEKQLAELGKIPITADNKDQIEQLQTNVTLDIVEMEEEKIELNKAIDARKNSNKDATSGSSTKKNKKDKQPTPAAIGSISLDVGILKRLQRVASRNQSRTTILSQIHLTDALDTINKQIVNAVQNNKTSIPVVESRPYSPFDKSETIKAFQETLRGGFKPDEEEKKAAGTSDIWDDIEVLLKGILTPDQCNYWFAVISNKQCIISLFDGIFNCNPRPFERFWDSTAKTIENIWINEKKRSYGSSYVALNNNEKIDREQFPIMYQALKKHFTSKVQQPSHPTNLQDASGLVTAWNRQAIIDLLDRASLACGLVLKFFVDNHVPVPFYLRTWRPSKTYNMGSMIRMISGAGGAARTLYRNPDFMMADNAAQKMIFGHFTMYNKTVVFYPEKITIGQNVFCESYIGGNGVGVWNPNNEYELESYKSGELIRDMFVTQGPMNKAATATYWLSMTGFMPTSLNTTNEVGEMVWYEGCSAYSNFWNWRTDARTDYGIQSQFRPTSESERKSNVICMQEVQIKWDPANHRWDLENAVVDAGHWGEYVYPGCGKVRAGLKATFEHPNYMPTKSIGMAY